MAKQNIPTYNEMTVTEAITILESHNEWRRGAETQMGNPKDLGIAIEIVLEELKKSRLKLQ